MASERLYSNGFRREENLECGRRHCTRALAAPSLWFASLSQQHPRLIRLEETIILFCFALFVGLCVTLTFRYFDRCDLNPKILEGNSMSLKSDVVALLVSKKEEKLAAVAVEADALISAVQAMPEDVPADVSVLQAKLDAALAEVAKDEELLAAELSKEEKLLSKLASIKAALES